MAISILSAQNSMERIVDMLEARTGSEVGTYSETEARLSRIRELGERIMLLANSALIRTDSYDPRYLQYSDISGDLDSFVQKVADIAASKAVAVASASASAVVNFNGVELTPKESEVEIIPVAEQEHKELPEKKPTKLSTIGAFKRVTTSTCIGAERSASQHVKILGKLISEYFNIRFSTKSDPNRIHRFSSTELRNYLASIILNYSQSVEDDFDFETYFHDWLNQVKLGEVRYTLPPKANSIFFTIAMPDRCVSPVSITRSVYERAVRLWKCLWRCGMCGFSMLEDSDVPLPTIEFDWFNLDLSDDYEPVQEIPNDLVELTSDVEYPNLSQSDLVKVSSLWSDFLGTTMWPGFEDACEYLLKTSEEYRVVFYAHTEGFESATAHMFCAIADYYGVGYLEDAYTSGYVHEKNKLGLDPEDLGVPFGELPDNWILPMNFYWDYAEILKDESFGDEE